MDLFYVFNHRLKKLVPLPEEISDLEQARQTVENSLGALSDLQTETELHRKVGTSYYFFTPTCSDQLYEISIRRLPNDDQTEVVTTIPLSDRHKQKPTPEPSPKRMRKDQYLSDTWPVLRKNVRDTIAWLQQMESALQPEDVDIYLTRAVAQLQMDTMASVGRVYGIINLQGKSLPDIGARIGLTGGTIRSRIERAQGIRMSEITHRHWNPQVSQSPCLFLKLGDEIKKTIELLPYPIDPELSKDENLSWKYDLFLSSIERTLGSWKEKDQIDALKWIQVLCKTKHKVFTWPYAPQYAKTSWSLAKHLKVTYEYGDLLWVIMQPFESVRGYRP